MIGLWQVCPQPFEHLIVKMIIKLSGIQEKLEKNKPTHFSVPGQHESEEQASTHIPIPDGVGQNPGFGADRVVEVEVAETATWQT